jgi:hypothetical protein
MHRQMKKTTQPQRWNQSRSRLKLKPTYQHFAHARRAAGSQTRAAPRERWGTTWDGLPVDGVRGPLPRRPMRNEAPTYLTFWRWLRFSLWPVSGLATHRPHLPTRNAQWHTHMLDFGHAIRTDLHDECGRLPLRGQRRFARCASRARRVLLPV